ncbi:LPS-assembly protein [Rhodoblastus acidophilus]|uniref:LPS-assembly protein LptD n=1 Tax=Rhodoblastus acidophilus TaxID=1074 RepID=A0A212RG94_RHOAC|nr:LPS assembly protein LptD [Rhodoblastus acidophilus]SNB71243.1 LPS-assembly protein [Rhodoblastus acidophilus]
MAKIAFGSNPALGLMTGGRESLRPSSFGLAHRRVSCRVSWLALVLALGGALCAPWSDAQAQTLNERFAAANNSGDKTPMNVDANKVTYNDRDHTVVATGDVQIYYKKKTLEADKVTYYRDTGRVLAEGSVKLTDSDGSVTHADRMELSGDFKRGFVDSARSDSNDRTHMTSTRTEKLDEETTVFEKGAYTACDTCADHPERAPVWRLRAQKIVHKNAEQRLYYENATFELFGLPMVWFPFLSTPDPSVTRASGFLAPHLSYNATTTGFGVGQPYFWVISPDKDVTVTPYYYGNQGFRGDVEYRQRLDNGYFTLDLTGIHQNNPSVFAGWPYGAEKTRTDRGMVQSQGVIWLNQSWKFGWDIARASDKWFNNDYAIGNSTLNGNFFRENSSTVYLTGQGDRGYFDLRGYSFQGLANTDYQPQLAAVWPILDYNKTISLDPAKTWGIGGEVEIDANFTRSTADLASYQQIGSYQFDSRYGMFAVCRATGTTQAYSQSNCLLRGIGGEYDSATLQLSWKRKFIDPLGEVWTPFTFARANVNYLNARVNGGVAFGSDTVLNSDQQNFLSHNDQFGGYITPGAGLEWRYPLLTKTPIGEMVVEPIAQIIARPNGQPTNNMVNLDAQSLVFDDSNLFEWNKYSGYDRFETGVRANYGAQFTYDLHDYGYASALVGQSAQVAGVNSYATPDAANIGLSSGLDKPQSDYVTRLAYAPSANYSFVAKARFDESDWSMRRLDVQGRAKYGPLGFGVNYANYTAQPIIGYNERREGLGVNTRYDVFQNYFVQGDITWDLGRHNYNGVTYLVNGQTSYAPAAPLFAIATWGAGIGYQDECLKLGLNYRDSISDGYGYPPTYARNKSVVFTLELRTLGDIRAPFSLTPSVIQDGVRTQ